MQIDASDTYCTHAVMQPHNALTQAACLPGVGAGPPAHPAPISCHTLATSRMFCVLLLAVFGRNLSEAQQAVVLPTSSVLMTDTVEGLTTCSHQNA